MTTSSTGEGPSAPATREATRQASTAGAVVSSTTLFDMRSDGRLQGPTVSPFVTWLQAHRLTTAPRLSATWSSR